MTVQVYHCQFPIATIGDFDNTSVNSSRDVYNPEPPNAAEIGHYLSEEEGTNIIHTAKLQQIK